VGGNLELQNRYGCEIFGNESDRSRIPGISRTVRAGESFRFGSEEVQVFGADGHTHGHIVYWFPKAKALFCGDVIFSLGCGKLFEGSAEEMWATLARLRDLPGDTLVYCAHEYTLENAAFALLMEPNNPDLRSRIAVAAAQREKGEATVPSTMDSERAANPFLRPESTELQNALGIAPGTPLWKIFAATRARKDAFDSTGI
jgi:hydroxyacylglutathione hydrolase